MTSDEWKRMKEPIYVGYYTPGAYEGEWAGLRESLEALGLEHDYRRVEAGSWQEVTQRKARVMQEALERHAGRPVVYLDVDAVVLRRPVLLDGLRCDVAASVWPGGELLSGTVWWGPGPKAREVVEEWIRLNEAYPERLPDGREAWDQRTLRLALRRVEGVEFEELPPAYCYMIGLSQRRFPELDPVILHLRGSLRHNPNHE